MTSPTKAAAPAEIRKISSAPARRPAFRGLSGTGLPAMPESPIPDLAPRNRTPDPTERAVKPAPGKG